MISLELAKQLKDAGLEWDYEYGFPRDYVYYKGKIHEVEGPGTNDTFRLAPWQNYVKREYLIFAPTLSQILSEIEKRGYCWGLSAYYSCSDTKKYLYFCKISGENKFFTADTPEEVAAAALLWVMKEGKCANR